MTRSPAKPLRHHNPMGGPGTREPADGSESPMRVSLGFEPAWYYQRCGVDFSESWHTDPVIRYQALKKMKAELMGRFPQVSCWDEDHNADLATVSGCYGIYVIPLLFGFKIRYAPDRWPLLEPGGNLETEAIETLSVKTLLQGSFVETLFRQMETIEARWGKIHGYLNYQGVLNNGFHLRGQELFLDICRRMAAV